jgi:hypothetical protein
MWVPIGKRWKSSISLLLNSWSESNYNNSGFVFFNCCLCSSHIWHQYRKCRFKSCQQSRTSPLAMMPYKLVAMVVLSLWLKSWPGDLVSWHQQPFFHEITIMHHMIAHLSPSFSKLHAFCVDHSHLPLNLMIWSRFLFLIGQTSSLSHLIFHKSLIKNLQPYLAKHAPSCSCQFIIAKPFQATPHWYLVGLPLRVSQSYDCFPVLYILASSATLMTRSMCPES